MKMTFTTPFPVLQCYSEIKNKMHLREGLQSSAWEIAMLETFHGNE